MSTKTVPPRYLDLLAKAPLHEVSFGYGGLKLFEADEIEAGQTGYSVSAQGVSFCDGSSGAWQSDWVVIGNDTSLGDPIFLSADPRLPIFTAPHGEGSWDAQLIASSAEGFFECFRAFSEISEGRSDGVQQEANPVSDEEREAFASRISQFSGGQESTEFWINLLES